MRILLNFCCYLQLVDGFLSQRPEQSTLLMHLLAEVRYRHCIFVSLLHLYHYSVRCIVGLSYHEVEFLKI